MLHSMLRMCFCLRNANHALKLAIAEYEGLPNIDCVYTLRDAGRRFGVVRSTMARWSDIGVFVAKVFFFNGKSYRYYTKDQCDAFEQTDFYKRFPSSKERMCAGISSTVHDFMDPDVGPVFTVAECATKFGISIQSIERMDRSGEFRAMRVFHNNRVYRYYTEDQVLWFLKSGRYDDLSHVKNSDIINVRFDRLTVLSYSDSAKTKGYYGSYVCRCDCGNVIEVPRCYLLSGKARSCGCYVEPVGEFYIRQYLQHLGLSIIIGDSDGYIQHKTYDDLRGVHGGKLSYDFYVRRGSHCWLIEYQGKQHYEPIEFFGGNTAFEFQLIHDKRKQEYAMCHNISLIEVPYNCDTYDKIAKLLSFVNVA